MGDGALRRYMDDAGRYPMMDAAEEVELLKGWDVPGRRPAIRQRMVEGSLRFAVAVAAEMQTERGKISLQDAVGEANLGLMEAARRFDPAQGVRFISYAVWWIRMVVRRAQDESTLVRCPQSLLHSIWVASNAERTLYQTLERVPDEEEMVEGINANDDYVKSAHGYRWTASKLRQVRERIPLSRTAYVCGDAPVGGDLGPVFWDVTADPAAAAPDEDMDSYDAQRLWGSISSTLTDQERTVLERRHGIGCDEPATLQGLGEEMGISRERVRQIEQDARAKIIKHHRRTLREALA